MLNTKFGKSIRFESKKLRIFKGRSSKGIRGMNLSDNDQVVSLSILDNIKEKKADERFIFSITENGYGKITSHKEFKVTNRGGKGIVGIKNSKRNGNVSSSFPVYKGDEILISTNKGKVIRVAVNNVRILGRATQGTRIQKLNVDEKVVSANKVEDNLI